MKIFYGRASTKGSGRQEASPDIQLNEVEAKYGKMDKTFVDRCSGDAPLDKRPALIEALDALGKGSILYCYSFSRIARDTFFHLWLEKEASVKGFELISVAEEDSCGSGAEKKLFRTLIAAISEYEKSVIRARTIASRAKMRKDGRYLGGKRRYGYRIVGDKVEPISSERETINWMISKKKAGRSIRLITEDLNKAGIESVTGSPWHYSSVKGIVKRELAKEHYEGGGEINI